MSKILYRSIEKKDYAAVCEMINQSFGLYRYITDGKMLTAFKQQYLYSCLSEATFTCVAVKDGIVIGTIMGKADSHYRVVSHIPYAAKMFWYSVKMRLLSDKNTEGIKDYQRLHQVYRQFDQMHKTEFDGVLTLFAVSEASRGLGIGKQLWQRLREYLQHCGTRKIYLYTDSTCNTGFYYHQGFSCVEQQALMITRNGEKTDMRVYLYSKNI